jgi:GTP-binding protein
MNPLYRRAVFLTSAAKLSQTPPDEGCEVAFAGRSNAGKSSAINTLCDQRALARTSKTPGRTQLLNFFAIDAQRRLVDLPGYGYAQVSHRERRAWQELVEGYISRQGPLRLVLLLVDARRGMGAEEHQLMAWLAGKDLPCHLVVTKADKLGAAERGSLRERLRKQAAAGGTRVSLVSGTTGEGVDELWSRIGECVPGADEG